MQVDPSQSLATVLVTGDVVYVGSSESLTCLRYPTGEVVWSRRTHNAGPATLMLAADRLFVARAGEVECFSLAGESLWHDALTFAG